MPLIVDGAQPQLPGLDAVRPPAVTVHLRDGSLQPFDVDHIVTTVRQAFRAERNIHNGNRLEEVDERRVLEVAEEVGQRMLAAAAEGYELHASGIRETVEMTLMEKGFYAVARGFILAGQQR